MGDIQPQLGVTTGWRTPPLGTLGRPGDLSREDLAAGTGGDVTHSGSWGCRCFCGGTTFPRVEKHHEECVCV